MFQRVIGTVILLIASTLQTSAVEAADTEPSSPGNPSEAIFEDVELDLGESWGDASACIELGDRTECFRSEQELLAAHPAYSVTGGHVRSARATSAPTDGEITPMATCSTSLRLYRSTGFTGGTLVLTTRAVVLNLSTYGFDNDTSSYRVGACASTFWAGASGSGSVYPGPTGANASASSMLSGWNNVVSSVYIS
jgi:hypothetical protein